jgi:hypothetical protein
MFLRASLAELGGVVSTNARWRRRPYSVTTFVLFLRILSPVGHLRVRRLFRCGIVAGLFFALAVDVDIRRAVSLVT